MILPLVSRHTNRRAIRADACTGMAVPQPTHDATSETKETCVFANRRTRGSCLHRLSNRRLSSLAR